MHAPRGRPWATPTLRVAGLAMVVALLCSSPTGSFASTPCGPMPDWVRNKVGGGVDLTTFSVFPPNANSRPEPVLDFTCDNGYTWRDGYTSTVYPLPDQLLSIEDDNSAATVAMSFSSSTSAQYAVGVSESFSSSSCFLGIVCSSSSQSAAAAASAMFNNSMAVGAAWSYVESYNVKAFYVPSIVPFNLSQRAQELYDHVIAPNPTFNGSAASRAAYDEFRGIFGTHFFTNMTLGGWLLQTFEVDRSTFSAYGQSSVSAQASVTFLNTIAAAGGGGSSQSIQGWFSAASSFSALLNYGGQGAGLTPATWSKWMASVATAPVITRFFAVPISELLPAGPQRDNMQLYIQDRQCRSALSWILSVANALVADNFGVSTSGAACNVLKCPAYTCSCGYTDPLQVPAAGSCYYSQDAMSAAAAVRAAAATAVASAKQLAADTVAATKVAVAAPVAVLELGARLAVLVAQAVSPTCTASSTITTVGSLDKNCGGLCFAYHVDTKTCETWTWPSALVKCS